MPILPPVYGWKPDVKDHRDLVMTFDAVDLSTLPQVVDLRSSCSLVEDQSALGSCTANATAGALEYLEIKDKINSFENFSRLFIYYNMRAITGETNIPCGGSLRNALKAVADSGSCDEKIWNYDVLKFADRPIDAAYEDAAKHKITEYSRLESFPDMLQCLASGFPFVFGFSVYESLERPQMAQTGILSLPQPGEMFLGGHAVLCVGYDIKAETVLVRNSWGSHWGQGGYFTMPFAYIGDSNLACDFWTIRR
jgi:C1A family cysteine protease